MHNMHARVCTYEHMCRVCPSYEMLCSRVHVYMYSCVYVFECVLCTYVCMYETCRIDVLGVESRYFEYMKAIVLKM